MASLPRTKRGSTPSGQGRRTGRAASAPLAGGSASQSRARREELRNTLQYERIFPDGEKDWRLRWEDARRIGWANSAIRREPGYSLPKTRAQDRLREAAEESPNAMSAKCRAVIAECEPVLGESCAAQLKFFQTRAQAAVDAARDLRQLGYQPTPGLIEAYLLRIGEWQGLVPTEDESNEAFVAAERGAPPDALEAMQHLSKDFRLPLAPLEFGRDHQDSRAWKRTVRLIVEVRLIHERALGFRGEYLQLKHPPLPSAPSFRALVAPGLSAVLAKLPDQDLEAQFQLKLARTIAALHELRQHPKLIAQPTWLAILERHFASVGESASELELHPGLREHLFVRESLAGQVRNELTSKLRSQNHEIPLAACRDMFDSTLRALCASNLRLRRESLETLVGASAADASRWRLRALEWRLQQADFLLDPRGTYQSDNRPPKQIGVWYALALGLRGHLRTLPSQNAKNRIIAAVFRIYAGPQLRPPGMTTACAVNTIEKLRKRVDRVQAEDGLMQLRLRGGIL